MKIGCYASLSAIRFNGKTDIKWNKRIGEEIKEIILPYHEDDFKDNEEIALLGRLETLKRGKRITNYRY